MRFLRWPSVRTAALISFAITIAIFFAVRTRLSAAGEASNPVFSTAYPTIESAGIDMVNNGDSNANASVGIEYREQGQTAWKTGQPCVRQPFSRHRCSLFFLAPGTTYDYRVVVSDPDGVNPPTLSGFLITRSDSVATTTLRTLYVSPDGDDSAVGTDESHPLRTIQRAADLSQPGDRILALPGVYRESVSITLSGQVGKPIVFESSQLASEPGSTPAIIDGAEPGLDVIDGVDNWLPDPAGNPGVYYTTLSSYAAGEQVIYVARGEEKVYAYSYYPYQGPSNFDNFLNGIFCPSGGVDCFATEVSGGYFYDEPTKRLYVKLTDGSDPDGSEMHVAKRNSKGILIDGASNVIIRGLHFRYWHSGIVVRATETSQANDNVIEKARSSFTNFGMSIGGLGTYGNKINRTVVQDNVIADTVAQTIWPWRSVKLNDVESTGIAVGAGTGTVVRRNVIADVFNGIDMTVWWDTQNPSYNTEVDITANTVTDTGDDAIELDGPSQNVRAWDNLIYSARGDLSGQSGFSLAVVSVGPAYVVRNTILDVRQSAFKFSSGYASALGKSFIYHNTVHSANTDLFAVVRITQSNNAVGVNAAFRNNIFSASGTEGPGQGYGYVIEDASTDHVSPPVTLDFDYNDYFSSRTCQSGTCPFLSWLSVNYPTLAAWSAVNGQEAHGLTADPGFTDAAARDFGLQPTSQLIDRGVTLPNINDGYDGPAPDLGAYEFQMDSEPPAAVTDLTAL